MSRRHVDPETRHRVMASIHSEDTRPEMALRRALWRLGIRGYRCHVRTVPGSPDVVFSRGRLAVFVDGVWWHGHPDWFTPGRRGPYWDRKISGNRARDARVDAELAALGWSVLRLWDVDILRDAEVAAAKVAQALHKESNLAPE
jgi:DNA mismatch endonuclease (patch repair protein)